jgi:phosphoribosylanthranilate isomerase
MIQVKICGLRRPAEVAAAAAAGAAYVGFVFFAKSPRNLALAEARPLAEATPPGVLRVALTVDAGDDALDELTAAVPLDLLQLHGSESPERVAAIRARRGGDGAGATVRCRLRGRDPRRLARQWRLGNR